jgi:hypothetical protein
MVDVSVCANLCECEVEVGQGRIASLHEKARQSRPLQDTLEHSSG